MKKSVNDQEISQFGLGWGGIGGGFGKFWWWFGWFPGGLRWFCSSLGGWGILGWFGVFQWTAHLTQDSMHKVYNLLYFNMI